MQKEGKRHTRLLCWVLIKKPYTYFRFAPGPTKCVADLYWKNLSLKARFYSLFLFLLPLLSSMLGLWVSLVLSEPSCSPPYWAPASLISTIFPILLSFLFITWLLLIPLTGRTWKSRITRRVFREKAGLPGSCCSNGVSTPNCMYTALAPGAKTPQTAWAGIFISTVEVSSQCFLGSHYCLPGLQSYKVEVSAKLGITP